MEMRRAGQYLSINRAVLLNPFILGGLAGALGGNYSLGLITGGLTVLVWGFSPGMNFIALTTISLVLLTGNINLELIFLFTLSLAWLIRSRGFMWGFWLLPFPVVLTFPLWRLLLGLLPAGLLNEFNISGQLLLVSGFALTLLRGYRSVGSESAGFFLKLLAVYLALQADSLVVPCWIGGSLLLPLLEKRLLSLPPFTVKTGCSLAVLAACLLLTPPGLSLAAVLGIGFIALSGWPGERLPVLEMVYLSFILGILGSQIGLFR